MADYDWTKPTPGGSSGTWGTELNGILDVIQAHPGIKVVADATARGAYVPLLGQLLLQADTGKLYKCTNATGPVWAEVGQADGVLTTKGDLYVYGSADARLPVGTDGHVLTADSAQALGVKWTDAPAATNGIPTGGTAGQILEKIDGTDYNAQWVDVDAVKIKSKNVNIPNFAGKNGYVLAYDEVAGEFYLKADDGGGGGSEFTYLAVTDKQFLAWEDYAISTIAEPV